MNVVGRTISHYIILEKLGQGGMGVVYKAEDTKLKRLVALKFLQVELICNEEAKARFMHEAQAASALDHPNICTIYEINETDDGEMFIAMAYYEGETLQQKLARGESQVAEAIDIAIQISQGLAKAHEHDIVHRDLKPANVIITKDGVAKILDFGLAKLAGKQRLTKTGSTLGTMPYISPEQARGEEVDHRTDIWALGVVLYEMITGQLPFKGEHEYAIMYEILRKDPQPLSTIIEDIPRLLETTTTKALEKRPSARYQSTEEILKNLKEAQKELEISQKPPYGIFTLLLRIRYHKRVIKKATFLLLSILFITAAIIIFEIFRSIEVNQIYETKRQGRILIAVMYFSINTNDLELMWLSRGIPDMLVTDLDQSQYLRAVSIEKLDEIARNNGGQEKNTGGSSALQIARSAGAGVMVSGRVIKDEHDLRILAQLHDLDADSLIFTEKISSKNHQTIIAMVDYLSKRIKLALEISASDTPGIAEGIAQTKTSSVEAYKNYILGIENLEKSQYTEAITNLRRAIQFDSAFAYAYTKLTNTYDILGDIPLAEKCIHKAIQFSERMTTADKLKIRLQYVQLKGEWDMALDYLSQLAALQPEEANWYFHLGWHYATHLRSYERSVNAFNKAIEIDPYGQPRFYYYLGYTYLNYGRRDEAISTFKTYASLLPKEAQSHDVLGVAYMLTGNYDKALYEFNAALKTESDFYSSMANLGDLYRARGMHREALKYYQRYFDVAKGKNEKEMGHYYLGRFYLENDKLPAAAQEIRQALASDSVMIEGYWIQGLIEVQSGRVDSAEATAVHMERILLASHSDYQREFFHHLKGKIDLARDRPDSAINEFERALTLGPQEQAYFRIALATAYFQKEDWHNCVRTCNYVLAYNPQYAPAYVLLGQVHEERDRIAQAIQAYEKCLEIWIDADENVSMVNEIKGRLSDLKNRK
ncbi:MAG: protein kinase domain-containing protein [bacterium]